MDITTYMINKSNKYLESLIYNTRTIIFIIEEEECNNTINCLPLIGIRSIICNMNDIIKLWAKETSESTVYKTLPDSFVRNLYIKHNNFYLKLPYFDINIYYNGLDRKKKKKLKYKKALQFGMLLSKDVIDFNFANMKINTIICLNIMKKYLTALKYLYNYLNKIIKYTNFNEEKYIISNNLHTFNSFYSDFL